MKNIKEIFMLVVVSPAKKLNMSLVQGLKVSKPYFKKNVDELVNVVRDLSVKDLEKLMDIIVCTLVVVFI